MEMEYPKLKEFIVGEGDNAKVVRYKTFLTFIEMHVIIDNMLQTDSELMRQYIQWFYYVKYLTDIDDDVFKDANEINQQVRDRLDYYNAWGLFNELEYDLNSDCINVINGAINRHDSTANMVKAFTDTVTDSLNKALKSFSKEDVNSAISKFFDGFKELQNANNSDKH